MPTYRNDASETSYVLTDTDGNRSLVKPGESVQTYQYHPDNADLTLISDSPYYPFCLAQASPTIEAAGDMDAIPIDASADTIEIFNKSNANLTLYFQAKANTNTLYIPSDYVRTIENIQGRFTHIIIAADAAVGADELHIHQLIGD